MATEVRWRRGTAAQHAAFVGAMSEFTHDTTKNAIRVHDGITPGGNRTLMEGDLDPVFGTVQAKHYTPSIANAVERTVESKLNDAIDARDFGVVADGVAGVAAALNLAISMVAAMGGGIISLPSGNLLIDDTIVLRSSVSLVGKGIDATIFKAKNALNKPLFTTLNTEALWGGSSEEGEQFWGLSAITIDGNRENQTSGSAIRTYSRSYRMLDVKIVYAKERGIDSRWGDGAAWEDSDDFRQDLAMEASLSNVYIGWCGREGIRWGGPHDSQWLNVIVGLCSQDEIGTYSGILVEGNSGGLQAINVHSWGDSHKHAFDLQCSWLHFANCEADDAYTALINWQANNIVWTGGVQFGAIFNDPPTAHDLALKGFVLGSPGISVQNPRINCSVLNCPGGAVNFVNVSGDYGGEIRVSGSLASSVRSGSVGVIGSVPKGITADINIPNASSNWGIRTFSDSISIPAGTAAAPGITSQSNFGNGINIRSDGVGISVLAQERFSVGDGYVVIPRRSSDPISTWVSGMMYFNTTTKKARIYDGSLWNDLY